MASFAMDLLELSGAVSDPDHAEAHGMYQATFMGAPGSRIAGGSDEIMLNILSERVLGAAPGRPCRQGNPVQRGAHG